MKMVNDQGGVISKVPKNIPISNTLRQTDSCRRIQFFLTPHNSPAWVNAPSRCCFRILVHLQKFNQENSPLHPANPIRTVDQMSLLLEVVNDFMLLVSTLYYIKPN